MDEWKLQNTASLPATRKGETDSLAVPAIRTGISAPDVKTAAPEIPSEEYCRYCGKYYGKSRGIATGAILLAFLISLAVGLALVTFFITSSVTGTLLAAVIVLLGTTPAALSLTTGGLFRIFARRLNNVSPKRLSAREAEALGGAASVILTDEFFDKNSSDSVLEMLADFERNNLRVKVLLSANADKASLITALFAPLSAFKVCVTKGLNSNELSAAARSHEIFTDVTAEIREALLNAFKDNAERVAQISADNASLSEIVLARQVMGNVSMAAALFMALAFTTVCISLFSIITYQSLFFLPHWFYLGAIVLTLTAAAISSLFPHTAVLPARMNADIRRKFIPLALAFSLSLIAAGIANILSPDIFTKNSADCWITISVTALAGAALWLFFRFIAGALYHVRTRSYIKRSRVNLYDDALHDDFLGIPRGYVKIDSSFKYDSGWFARLLRLTVYRWICRPVLRLAMKIMAGQKVVGREKLRREKSGYFIFANHTNGMTDALNTCTLTAPKFGYVLCTPENLSGIKNLTMTLGALPIPNDFSGMRNFVNAVDARVNAGNAIVIYPEAHIWPYYCGIREFPSMSFNFPVKNNKPSYVVTTTYHKSKIFSRPRQIVYIDGPFYADSSLPLSDQKNDLCTKVYAQMCDRAKSSSYAYRRYQKKQ